MELIMEQMPIVIRSLNSGFLQTLKLFFVTLVGAVPLGLVIAFGSMSRFKPLKLADKFIVWIIRGTPLMIQLMIVFYFPGLVFHNQIWRGTAGRFAAAARSLYHQLRLLFLGDLPGRHPGRSGGQEEAGLVLGMTKQADLSSRSSCCR